MKQTGKPDPPIVAYLTAVTGLSALAIGMLYLLFQQRLLPGVGAFSADPSGTLRNNPTGVLFVVGIVLTIVALVAVIVVFGARYAQPPDERPE